METVYDKEIIEEWLNRITADVLVKMKDAMDTVDMKSSLDETLNDMKQAALNAKKSVIDEEIEEAKGTISNENIWLNGSSTDEERELHSENIATLTYYIEKLEEMKDE